MSRIGKFFAEIRAKVIASSLAAALVTAFAPMVGQLVDHGVVKVTRGQIGLAVLVGFLTFLSGWLKRDTSAVAVTVEDVVNRVLAILPSQPLAVSGSVLKSLQGPLVDAVREGAKDHLAALIDLATNKAQKALEAPLPPPPGAPAAPAPAVLSAAPTPAPEEPKAQDPAPAAAPAAPVIEVGPIVIPLPATSTTATPPLAEVLPGVTNVVEGPAAPGGVQ